MSISPTGILETTLYAEDLEAAELFYHKVLGLPVVVKEPGHHVFFRCGEAMLLIFDPRRTRDRPAMGARLPVPAHGAAGAGHVCFRALGHEFPRWIAQLKAAGVSIEADFEWPSGGRSIYFRDPAGNSLEFAEPRLWAAQPAQPCAQAARTTESAIQSSLRRWQARRAAAAAGGEPAPPKGEASRRAG